MFTLNDDRYNEIKLMFDEAQHRYTDNFGREYISVTTLLHEYKPKFDESYWLKKKSIELELSQEQLKQQWDEIREEACKRGTIKHNNLEDGIKSSSQFKNAVKYMRKDNGQIVTIADLPVVSGKLKEFTLEEFIDITNNKYPDINNVFKYYSERGYQIYAEIGAFLINSLISGTIDVLCIREDGFVVGDWKTNRDGLQFESGYYKKDKKQKPNQLTDEWIMKDDKLLAPLHNLPDCNGSLYTMQLSMYAYMVVKTLGLKCKGIWLAHIDCDFEKNEYGMPKRFPDGTYHVKQDPHEKVSLYKINFHIQDVINVIKDRMNVVNSKRLENMFEE